MRILPNHQMEKRETKLLLYQVICFIKLILSVSLLVARTTIKVHIYLLKITFFLMYFMKLENYYFIISANLFILQFKFILNLDCFQNKIIIISRLSSPLKFILLFLTLKV